MTKMSGTQVTASVDLRQSAPKTICYNLHPTSDAGTIPPGTYTLNVRAGYFDGCDIDTHWAGTLT
jgi:hypothetical protein